MRGCCSPLVYQESKQVGMPMDNQQNNIQVPEDLEEAAHCPFWLGASLAPCQ